MTSALKASFGESWRLTSPSFRSLISHTGRSSLALPTTTLMVMISAIFSAPTSGLSARALSRIGVQVSGSSCAAMPTRTGLVVTRIPPFCIVSRRPEA